MYNHTSRKKNYTHNYTSTCSSHQPLSCILVCGLHVLSICAHHTSPSGKLCLQDEDLTKKCIPQMAREVEHSQAPAIHNNIVVVLSDLAVRYSIKVDPYIPDMAACLKDESVLLRR